MLPSFLYLLLLSGLAMGRFWGRQDATSTDAAPSETAASDSPAVSDTSSPLNSTNDPNECHIPVPDPPSSINPFCIPTADESIDYDTDYLVTWDPALFSETSTDTIQIYQTNDSTQTSDVPDYGTLLTELTDIPNSDGRATINVPKPDNFTSNSTTLLLRLISNDSTTGNVTTQTGPSINLLNQLGADNTTSPTPSASPTSEPASSSSSPSPSPTSSSTTTSKKLGEKVGLPIGLLILLALLISILFFLCRRRRRRVGSSGIGSGSGGGGGGGNNGLFSRKSTSSRHRTGAASSTHRRQESFHDEPTRGVELQDRRASKEDTWGWGSQVSGSSPTSARGGNVFRDEVARQKSGWGR